jgi:hypothetical protein
VDATTVSAVRHLLARPFPPPIGAYTLAILTLMLRSGGTLRVAAPEPVTLG